MVVRLVTGTALARSATFGEGQGRVAPERLGRIAVHHGTECGHAVIRCANNLLTEFPLAAWRAWALSIKRFTVLHATAHELRPVGHARDVIDFFR